MIPVMCSCGYAAKIPETFVGQKLRCPKCTNLIDTNAPSAAPAPKPAPDPAPAPAAEAIPAEGKLCLKCKRPMRDEQLVCLHCGQRVEESESARIERKLVLEHQATTNEVHDLGKRAIAWAIAGFLTCLPVIGIVGLILGIQSIQRSREYQLPVNGLALGSLIIFGTQVSGWVAYLFIVVLAINSGMKTSEELGERIGEGFDGPPVPRIQEFEMPSS